MGDLSKETVKERFWIVISWIQFGFALLVLSSGAFVVCGEMFEVSYRTVNFEFSLIAGLIGLTTLGVSSFIFTGKLIFRPQTHTTLQAVVIVVAVFLSAASFYPEFSRSPKNTDSSTEIQTKDDELDYTKEFLKFSGVEWGVFTHKTTLRKLIFREYKNHNNLSVVFATVVNDTLVADAWWSVECLPNSRLTQNITCDSNGKRASALYIVKPDNWEYRPFLPSDSSPLRWRLREGGFSVAVDFDEWPLDTLRQQDAIFIANGTAQPDLTEITSVRETFWYGSED